MVFNILAPSFMLFTFLVVQILKLVMLNDFDESIGLSMSVNCDVNGIKKKVKILGVGCSLSSFH